MTDPTPTLLPCPFCGGKNIDPEGWASIDRKGPACDDCSGCADTVELWNSRPLASAPAPASSGVDAVAVKPLEWKRKPHGDDWHADCAIGRYEVGLIHVDYIAILRAVVGDDAEDFRLDFRGGLEAAKAAAQADYEQRIRSALSPAATPVSEAGGGPTYVVNCCNCGRIVDTREKDEGGDDFGSEVSDDRWVCSPECWDAVVEPDVLAKPASSPAPVRPIGNQGISDYQREIARNMAEGFAAWNAARQEALPSDEPASSPAGGGVHEAAIGLLSELDAYCVGSRAYDRRVNEARRALKAALSQSTSAGRVGE